MALQQRKQFLRTPEMHLLEKTIFSDLKERSLGYVWSDLRSLYTPHIPGKVPKKG